MAHLLVDEEVWTAIAEPALCQDPAGIECLARLLYGIKQEIDTGPEGAVRASQALLDSVALLYLYTDVHKAAIKLYVLSLEGKLKPQHEPLNLFNSVLKSAEYVSE